MHIEVRRYDSTVAKDWHSVLAISRNGVFLFERAFMDYHSERFQDTSAIAYLDGKPAALLPASLEPQIRHATSHAGLTFGGIVLAKHLRGDCAIAVVFAILDALKEWGVVTLCVKLLPAIFSDYPSEEVHYSLWRRGFSIVRRDLSSVIPLSGRIPFNASKKQAVARARKSGIAIVSADLPRLHALLTEVLHEKHGTAPVHTLEELQLLATRFPDRIVGKAALLDGAMVAATLLFKYGRVWHTQYMATSKVGRATGALDLVIESVLEDASAVGASHLSFGISTEQAGTVLNDGLLWQKESYGARSIVHDFIAGPL